MPTEEENVQFLYLVLTNDGAPTIDWDKVSAALDLNKGAVTKRWSRLKQSMEKGEAPGGTVYQFLWLCVKHSSRDNARNWTEIATKCNTTKGAAAKRYSRLKQAFDKGVPPPGITSSSDKTTTKTTKATASVDENIETATPPTPKRKRNPPKKKAAAAEEHNVKPEPEDSNAGSDVGEETKPKRAKANTAAKLKNTKGKAGGKNKNKNLNPPTPTTEATTWIKGEHEEDAFYDAPEGANGLPQDDRENTVDRVEDWLQMSG